MNECTRYCTYVGTYMVKNIGAILSVVSQLSVLGTVVVPGILG